MALLIGVGNGDRGDDAAGLAVARLVRAVAPGGLAVTELPGDQLGLLEAWEGRAEVYVADAVWSGGAPGTVYRFTVSPSAGGAPLGACFRHRGTHAFSLADVIELARALGRLPGRLTGYGIEGAAFEIGAPLSRAVDAAARDVAGQILRELSENGSNW
jgi:hydrogenase maturation protease